MSSPSACLRSWGRALLARSREALRACHRCPAGGTPQPNVAWVSRARSHASSSASARSRADLMPAAAATTASLPPTRATSSSVDSSPAIVRIGRGARFSTERRGRRRGRRRASAAPPSASSAPGPPAFERQWPRRAARARGGRRGRGALAEHAASALCEVADGDAGDDVRHEPDLERRSQEPAPGRRSAHELRGSEQHSREQPGRSSGSRPARERDEHDGEVEALPEPEPGATVENQKDEDEDVDGRARRFEALRDRETPVPVDTPPETLTARACKRK